MQSFCWPFHGVFFDQTKRGDAADTRYCRCIAPAGKTFNEQQNSVRIAPDDVSGTLAFLREKWAQFVPDRAMEYR